MEQGNDARAEDDRSRSHDPRLIGKERERVEDRFDKEFADGGFAYPTKKNAGDGDAELRGAEVSIKVFRQKQTELGRAGTVFGEGNELCVAHTHNGKFRRDEETVERHKNEDRKNAPKHFRDVIRFCRDHRDSRRGDFC